MLSQRSERSDCRLIVGIVSLLLIVGVGTAIPQPVHAEGASTESEGLPGHRVGGGTRVDPSSN